MLVCKCTGAETTHFYLRGSQMRQGDYSPTNVISHFRVLLLSPTFDYSATLCLPIHSSFHCIPFLLNAICYGSVCVLSLCATSKKVAPVIACPILNCLHLSHQLPISHFIQFQSCNDLQLAVKTLNMWHRMYCRN